jgi:hypothetical protein
VAEGDLPTVSELGLCGIGGRLFDDASADAITP